MRAAGSGYIIVPGFQAVFSPEGLMRCFSMAWLFELDFFFGDGLLAVTAFHDDMFFVDNVKDRGHRLVVGDALGVGAAYDVAQLIGQADRLFADDGVVLDDVDFGVGGKYGDFVQLVFLEIGVGDFYDALFAYFFAAQVIADGNIFVDVVEMEQRNDFEQLLRGYVVDDGAVFEGGDFQFFIG